jgi:hypothetical protein
MDGFFTGSAGKSAQVDVLVLAGMFLAITPVLSFSVG